MSPRPTRPPPTADAETRQAVALEKIAEGFSALPALATVVSLLRELNQKVEGIMAEFDDMNALLDDIKTATDANAEHLGEIGVSLTAQAARLQEIIDALRAGGAMTPEQKAALATKAQSIKTAVEAATSSLDDEKALLEQTGVDPNNPTPEPTA